jgi:hypothetical protein
MGRYSIPIPRPLPRSRSSNVCDLSGELYGTRDSEEGVVSSGSIATTGLWTCLPRKLTVHFQLVMTDEQVDCIDKWLTEKSSICPYCNRCARLTSIKKEEEKREEEMKEQERYDCREARRWWRRERC